MSNYTGPQLRHALTDAMEALQASVIKDYDDGQTATPRKIERIVDDACNAWDLGEDGRYDDESELEWCGYTVGAAGRKVGDYLEDDRCVDVALARPVAVHCLGSTSRLAQSVWWTDEAETEPPRKVPASEIRRGDIVVVRTGAGQQHGDHITVARGATEGDTFPTVEGNASGLLGDGTRGEGVVFRERSLDSVYAVYRLLLVHFEGSAL